MQKHLHFASLDNEYTFKRMIAVQWVQKIWKWVFESKIFLSNSKSKFNTNECQINEKRGFELENKLIWILQYWIQKCMRRIEGCNLLSSKVIVRSIHKNISLSLQMKFIEFAEKTRWIQRYKSIKLQNKILQNSKKKNQKN